MTIIKRKVSRMLVYYQLIMPNYTSPKFYSNINQIDDKQILREVRTIRLFLAKMKIRAKRSYIKSIKQEKQMEELIGKRGKITFNKEKDIEEELDTTLDFSGFE